MQNPAEPRTTKSVHGRSPLSSGSDRSSVAPDLIKISHSRPHHTNNLHQPPPAGSSNCYNRRHRQKPPASVRVGTQLPALSRRSARLFGTISVVVATLSHGHVAWGTDASDYP
ncbi:hypothetical protein EX30DRAFT_47845 [Ascodesmis nigricans]|uniref:Uncharacterized protein n=1 Tax=Ascodesmis nigricans TaxID=341454 RepID=A0A4S2MVV9_9PEZI|nr:hypothetical protein EX30DRAFT_47845 [Ascodesmis nigricans]